MNIGLPGTGFGGLFYLVGAVFMAVREVALLLDRKRKKRHVGLALQQAAMALSMVLAITVTIWAVFKGSVILGQAGVLPLAGATQFRLTGHVKPIVITVFIMIGLLVAIRLLDFFFKLKGKRERAVE